MNFLKEWLLTTLLSSFFRVNILESFNILSIEITFWTCNFIKKETLAQVFSCEFCEISKNTF